MSDDTPHILSQLAKLLGPNGLYTTPDDMAPYLHEWRGRYQGQAQAVLRPDSTAAVAKAVRICRAHKIPIVPQGGNTGLVGASVPINMPNAVVLSTDRLTAIRDIDPDNDSITVEAGCILSDIHHAAEQYDRIFPLRLASEGCCRIGGNIASNAGGMQAIKYGVMRDLVLGIEAVMPDGHIFNGLSKLRKDNTGYDIGQLLIGSEGTLGIITAASLKLFTRPSMVETAFVAVKTPQDAMTLLMRIKTAIGDALSVFELMASRCVDFATRHIPNVTNPLKRQHDWYVMIELSGGAAQTNLRDTLETQLASAMKDGIVIDAVLAQNQHQQKAIWHLRESISEAQRHEGGSIKHDISVPLSQVADFLDEALAAVTAYMPGIRPVPFGHAGDGNLHFNLSQPADMDKKDFLSHWDKINRMVHDIVIKHAGSISAEHGIGLFKRDELARTKDPTALQLMHKIKAALDPDNLMNPGRVVFYHP